MELISPKIAASLAIEVYEVQSETTAKFFLKNAVFSQKHGDTQHLKAKVGSRILNTEDGFGICARGGIGYENDIFLIFRGTTKANYGADIISDLRCGTENSKTGLQVHIGFNSIFNSMLFSIQEFIGKQIGAIGTIHIIGHSLGGAVAALVAEWLSVKSSTIKLYTFGAPKPGLEFFADKLTQKLGAENIHRVYHTTDVVPMVPVYPYTHSPVTDISYPIKSNSFISFDAHKISNYATSVGTRSWQTLKAACEKMADDNSVENWLKSDKPINPADPKTWEWINSGLVWVLRKVIGNAAISMQGPIVSSLSLADKIAWILIKGINLSTDASGWVLSLMRKIMQALGMKLAKTAGELTQVFMRSILKRLMTKMSEEAMRALRGLTQKA